MKEHPAGRSLQHDLPQGAAVYDKLLADEV